MTTVLRRLRKRRDFLRVAARGRKWATPGLVLQACPHLDGSSHSGKASDEAGRMQGQTTEQADTGAIGVGFTASRKVGGAVRRNRARRRLRALAAEVLPAAAMPGHDYVLIARAATLARPYDRLRDDLLQALRKTNTVRNVRKTRPESRKPA